MAAVNSTPVMTWSASLLAATGEVQSSNLYVSVNNTGGWEIQIPIKVQVSAVSNDPVVNVYPSYDGGVTYDTTPMTSMALPRVSGGGLTQGSIRLPTGQYLLGLLASGPNSQSFQVLSAVTIAQVTNV